MDEKKITYTCPMHPEIVRDAPGMCPECGMNLVPDKKTPAHKEHNKHEGHSTQMFLRKFWVSLVLTVPVLAYSDFFQNTFRFETPAFYGSQYVPAVLGTIIFFYGGLIFLQSAWRELKGKMPGMMTLIAIAISAAFLQSVYATLSGQGETLFWELATLITIMLLGHYIEMRAVSGAQGALKELSKLLPDKAEVLRSKQTVEVELSELKIGDVVLVRPGGRIPADGKVIDGESDVNESMITGESLPVEKRIGSETIAGTVNGNGALKIEVTRIGEQTFLAGVMRLVAEAQASKSRLQVLSDKAAFILTIVAVVVGGLTFVLWLLARAGLAVASERLVAVLVIACPHALGLAVPLVASISTTLAARNGFLVKQRIALELARKIDTVVFDKTGTLTKGEYGVDKVFPESGWTDTEILRIAASLDRLSEHAAAKAVVKKAAEMGVSLSEAGVFKKLPGQGASGKVDGKEVLVGGEAILEPLGIKPGNAGEEEAGKGKTLNYVVVDGKLAGVISLSDVIREESKEAVTNLKSMGIQTVMITGDSEPVAKWVAGELGIEKFFAKVKPGEKSARIKELQSRGRKVAMVGDGVNDAPALVQADLGVAIGAGTNVAIESAGIILVKNDPRDIVKIIHLSKLTFSKMLQNLFWATGYNVVAIPLAAGALAFKGIFLSPAAAAVLMSLSTVIVAVNALLLRRKTL